MPYETFLYDEIDNVELDSLFDKVTFYNELEWGLTLERFIDLKGLKTFVPASTFDFNDATPMNEEFVSMFEGTLYPFFGFAYRVDKVQFGFDPNESNVDHSRESIEHAQHIANFLVDEARLSANTFEWTNQETKSILSRNQQSEMVKLPKNKKDSSDSFFYTELYLF